MPKFTPAPPVTTETWRKLLALAEEISAYAPWEFVYDDNVIGLLDPDTGETRIGCILGNGEEIFAAVSYRRQGVRWILSMLDEPKGFEDFNNVEDIDCLKVEFVPKRELVKEDIAVLKEAAFKPKGRGRVWPQFRSAEPGWHPGRINQIEAAQLLADLPRMLAFYRLLETHPGLYEDRAPTEIPFLPGQMPDRGLTLDDLEWRPIVVPPAPALEPYKDNELVEKLSTFKRLAGCICEFDCAILPGCSFQDNGRPCFGRSSLLVETGRGLVIGSTLLSGSLPASEAVGRGFVEALLMAGGLPDEIVIGRPRFQNVLQSLCDELQIKLSIAPSLPLLEEAMASLGEYMQFGRR